MHLDVRIPIGLMFSLFGGVLLIFGALSDKTIYEQHSLGLNINLYWGAVLLLFGAVMLWLAWRGRSKSASQSGQAAPPEPKQKP